MSSRHGSILDTECWDEIKADATLPSNTRAPKWWARLERPSLLARAGHLVWPSFLDRPSGPRKQLSRTAYLDGLRGFAAFLVYWQHHQLWAHNSMGTPRILENGFGFEDKYFFCNLPGVRLFFNGGHFAVSVFFVISGYVLSNKPLRLIHAGEYLKLGDNVASALFRRWLRLNIPVICSTFLYMTSWHAFGYWAIAPRKSNYRDELWSWYTEFKNFSFVFNQGGEPWFSYDCHTWSIPVEFRGSIIIYTSLIAFSRCSRNARLWCELGLIFYFMYIVDGSYGSMFVAGMLLCDLDLLAQSDQLPRFLSRLERHKGVIFYALFFIGIYLGGIPAHSSDLTMLRGSPGWYYLSFLKPQAVFDYKWFFLFWGATLLVASIPRIKWLKSFFESRFNQYLGRISFAFYLVHGPILWTLADRLYVATGWSRDAHVTGIPNWINAFPISRAGPLGLDPSFLLPHLIILPVTIWIAEIFTRLIDEPTVKFSQWLYGKTMAPAGKF